MTLNNRIALGVLAVSFCGTFSSAQSAAANATDPATIAGAYAENPVNADLLYKGKVLTVEGVVTAISSNSARRGAREQEAVGSAAFASLSDVKKRFGGRAALEGVVSATNVTIWHCTFDASRVEELAQLRRNDIVILEGQLEGYSNFRHCRVVSKEVTPPGGNTSYEAVHDAGGKDSRASREATSLGDVATDSHTDGRVSPPKAIFAPDPEYAEEARKAKLQGKCVLWLVVGTDGRAHDIRVARALGLGLDEKAMEAVKTWKFEPAMKDGKPVAVQINVEVTFRLWTNVQLRSTIGDLGIQSVVATTMGDLVILKQQGDRNYSAFTLVKGAGAQPVSTVSLQLRRTDPRKGTFTLTVIVGNKTIEKKDRKVSEPLQFYADRGFYELVIWSVDKEKAAGYLSAPQ